LKFLLVSSEKFEICATSTLWWLSSLPVAGMIFFSLNTYGFRTEQEKKNKYHIVFYFLPSYPMPYIRNSYFSSFSNQAIYKANKSQLKLYLSTKARLAFYKIIMWSEIWIAEFYGLNTYKLWKWNFIFITWKKNISWLNWDWQEFELILLFFS
jgi:hypothetical protein